MHRITSLTLLPAGIILAIGLSAGCSQGTKTTVIGIQDYTEIASQMSTKLGESSFLAERTADSPPIVIAVRKVENLTSDMIPEGAKWYMQLKVMNSLPMGQLKDRRNIAFVVPIDRLREARRQGTVEDEFGGDREPTHVMTAVFRSMTRTEGKARDDYYFCEYQITDLKTRQIVWTDSVEFEKLATDPVWN